MTSERRDDLDPAYRSAFSRYVSRRSEGGLAAAYEIGRSAVVRGMSLPDLSSIHHAALLRASKGARSEEELDDVTAAASEFFREVLGAFEMTRRGFVENLTPAPGPAGTAPPPSRPRRRASGAGRRGGSA
jgi:Phosphoserine phosphatase RsbU, N-terminal domain